MNINIYYGGRGLIDDPTMYVVNKLQEVLEELHVHVTRINLFEQKNQITMLPQTLNDVDGLILATTVEWYGVGGYMQQFLDACWQFGNKEQIQALYMQPVVMSTTYGEKEATQMLSTAWEILGGKTCEGISGYVESLIEFEMNKGYTGIIEKKAEALYRTISQKMMNLPSSSRAMQHSVSKTHHIELTPKESEQLSKFAADDSFLKKQKQDIEELASMFKGMLKKEDTQESGSELEKAFKDAFTPQEDFSASYQIEINEKSQLLHIIVNKQSMECYFGKLEDAEVTMKLPMAVMNDIIYGRMSFQRAFMTGEMTSKGEFKILRMMDIMFPFSGKKTSVNEFR